LPDFRLLLLKLTTLDDRGRLTQLVAEACRRWTAR
jgi:hypothetical protein